MLTITKLYNSVFSNLIMMTNPIETIAYHTKIMESQSKLLYLFTINFFIVFRFKTKQTLILVQS